MNVSPQKRLAARDDTRRCFVVVVYEDSASRDVAIRVCKNLERTFEHDVRFDCSWWRFKYLADPEISRLAAQAALEADLILVAIDLADDLPTEVTAWFEQWSSFRIDTDANAALAVVQTLGRMRERTSHCDSYFRVLAHRAHLDYLPAPGLQPATASPDQLREDQYPPGAAGLDPTSGQQKPFWGWGINE